MCNNKPPQFIILSCLYIYTYIHVCVCLCVCVQDVHNQSYEGSAETRLACWFFQNTYQLMYVIMVRHRMHILDDISIVAGACEYGNELSGSIKCREF